MLLKNHSKIACGLGLIVSAIGFLVLLGWQFDIELLKRPISGLVAMNPITALGYFFSGIAIYFTEKQTKLSVLRITATALVLIIGTLKLADFFFNFNFNIDHWIYSDTALPEKITGISNHIAPTSALNFIFIGSALLLSSSQKAINNTLANYLALLIFLIGIFSTLGYVYFVPEFRLILENHPMTLYSSICSQLTAIAILVINHDKGFMKTITGSEPGGFVTRTLIPGTIIPLLFLGFILTYLNHYFSISTELVVALGISGVLLVFFPLIGYVALHLNKISESRDAAKAELNKAIQELSLSNEQFSRFFNQSPVPTIITYRDNGFKFVNDAFLDLLLFTREEIIGKNSADLNIISKEYRAKIFQLMSEKNNNFYNLETKVNDSKGKEHIVLFSIQPIKLGAETFFLSTLVNITERKEIEQEIIKNRERLNEAQKLSKVGSWDFNLQTQELFWSDELYHIFQLPKTLPDQLFEACKKKFHPDDITNLDDAITIANEKGETVVYEHRIILNDGSVRYLNGLAEIQNNEEGKPVWLKGTTQDITERKEIEEKLRLNNIELDLKNKELEQFAFIASHDLQEPLRTINSFTELLTNEYAQSLDENANTYIRFITQSSSRMSSLISGLLEYSRLGNKRLLLITDCNEIGKNALANLHATIKETGAIVEAGKLPVLKAYPLEMELLFQNLIGNAIKFRKNDGIPHVRISAKKTRSEWTFAFADNGIGIDPKYFDKIFVLFQRLHSRDAFKGSGIGLSHCKKIVELHNGKIWVESKPGEGSVFYFTIPVELSEKNV